MFYVVEVDINGNVEFPKIQLNQTSNMRVVFLGVSADYIEETVFLTGATSSVRQFAQPNNMTWNLNVSVVFYEFPAEVATSLIDNAYNLEGKSYYNITLLDNLLAQMEDLAVPERGYLFVFMRVPDGGVNHSWFYIQERPDLFLGRTDLFDSKPFDYWAFPPNFGGMRRALYFDISDVIEKNPTKTIVTNTLIKLFNNALSDVFVNLLGATDSRMTAADMQRYKNYEVKILWLNGTDGQLYPERIKSAFEDLMPWTNWTLTQQTRPMEPELSNLIESRTEQLSKPLNYAYTLANGSKFSIQASRNVKWEVWKDSGEYDPLSQYLFDQVNDYFSLTDVGNKSIIPVVFLQLRNDTAISGVAGIGPGISWFTYGIIIMSYQDGVATALGESSPILFTHQLGHEIGHWVSLSEHSSRFELGYPKVICSMRSLTNQFCAFCKDARARMSFISYYKAVSDMISENQAKAELLRNELEAALQAFNNWEYIQAVEDIISVYDNVQAQVPTTLDFVWIRLAIVGVAAIIVAVLIFRKTKHSSQTNKPTSPYVLFID